MIFYKKYDLNFFLKNIANYNFKKLNLLFSFFIILLHILVYVKYEIQFLNLAKYFFFHIFYIIIPGIFITSFFDIDNKNSYRNYSFYFGLGIFFLTFQYFIFFYFQKLKYIIYLNPILSIFFIIFNLKKKINFNLKSKLLNFFSSVNLFIILFLVFLFLFGSIMASPSLNVTEVATYPQDKLFNVALMEGLSRGFPPIDVRVAGENFNYHGYFVFIYLYLISFVTNISYFDLYFYFSQYFKIIFFVFSLTYFSNFLFYPNKNNSIIYLFVVTFFACSSLFYNFFLDAGKFANENLYLITVFPNGYMHAMTYIFLLIPEVINSIKYQSFSKKNFLLFVFFLIMIFGSKAPNAAFVIGALDLFLIFLIIFKLRISLQLKSYIIFANILFFIFYFLIYSNAQDNYQGIRVFVGSLFRNHHLYDSTSYLLFYNFLSIFFIPFHQILFYPFSVFLFYFYLCNFFFNKKKNIINFKLYINYLYVFLISSILISFTSYLFIFAYGGTSYFMMVSTYFFSIFSVKLLLEKNFSLTNYIKKIIFILFLVSILSTFFSALRHVVKGGVVFINTFVEKNDCKNKSDNKTIFNKFYKYFPLDNCPGWDKLTRSEYEGLVWLKRNTPKNSVILSDRLYNKALKINSHSRFFYYSVFSERLIFLEGFYYWVNRSIAEFRKNRVDEFFKKSFPEKFRKNFIIKNNIDYIIVSNFLNNNLNLDSSFFNIVFSNKDIKIYKVNIN